MDRFSDVRMQFDMLESAQSEIVGRWLNLSAVQTTLQQYRIPLPFFKKYFAVKVIEYAFGIVKGVHRPGNCPVIGVMLVFFEKKNLTLGDVFTICVNLKNTLIETAMEKGILDRALLQKICTLIDTNFLGVIRDYMDLHYNTAVPHASCSLGDKSADSAPAYCTTMPPSFEMKNITSAKTYAQELDMDTEILQELAEIEKETLTSFDLTGVYVQETHQDVIALFTQYAKMIDQLVEFQEISYALWILADILQHTNLDMFKGEAEYLSMYNKAIIHDLSTWRTSVFYDQSAEDIHYLDKTLLSSITQLQIMLSPSGNAAEDEIEFF